MSDYNDPCKHCGAYAMEIPDEDGVTWCAMCGEKAGDDGASSCEESLADADEKPDRRSHHKPHVAGRSERPLAQQASTRIADASSTSRRDYDTAGDDW